MAISTLAAGFGCPRWLTLPGCFPHKRANRVPVTVWRFQRHSGLCFGRFGGWVARLLRGELSRVAKGAAVNQPPHGFEGSSPSFPTSFIDDLSDFFALV